MSVETAINPLGKRVQFVFVGRKNATVYFCRSSAASVVSVVFCARFEAKAPPPRQAGSSAKPARHDHRTRRWRWRRTLPRQVFEGSVTVWQATPR